MNREAGTSVLSSALPSVERTTSGASETHSAPLPPSFSVHPPPSHHAPTIEQAGCFLRRPTDFPTWGAILHPQRGHASHSQRKPCRQPPQCPLNHLYIPHHTLEATPSVRERSEPTLVGGHVPAVQSVREGRGRSFSFESGGSAKPRPYL